MKIIRRHKILNTYVTLVRGEHFTESEIGETKDFINEEGCLVGSYPLLQLNWTVNELICFEICKLWKLTDQQLFKMQIIPKPTEIQNLVYSSELRRVFGSLSHEPGFDENGNFILPKQKGILVPVKENNLIKELKFYCFEELRSK